MTPWMFVAIWGPVISFAAIIIKVAFWIRDIKENHLKHIEEDVKSIKIEMAGSNEKLLDGLKEQTKVMVEEFRDLKNEIRWANSGKRPAQVARRK